MAVTYRIEREQQNGLRTKAVFAILKNTSPTTAYRRVEVITPLDVVDVEAWIGNKYTIAELWGMGNPASEAAWNRIDEKPLLDPIYEPILEQSFEALAKYDVDTVRALMVQLIEQNDELLAKFLAVAETLGIGTANDAESKREQIFLILIFAIIGKINGEDW
jgi:hypothetical protein